MMQRTLTPCASTAVVPNSVAEHGRPCLGVVVGAEKAVAADAAVLGKTCTKAVKVNARTMRMTQSFDARILIPIFIPVFIFKDLKPLGPI